MRQLCEEGGALPSTQIVIKTSNKKTVNTTIIDKKRKPCIRKQRMKQLIIRGRGSATHNSSDKENCD